MFKVQGNIFRMQTDACFASWDDTWKQLYEEKHQSSKDFLCEDLSQGALVVISGDITELWNMKWNII